MTSKQIKDGTIQMVDVSKQARSQLSGGGVQGHVLEGTWRFTATRVGLTPPTFTGFVWPLSCGAKNWTFLNPSRLPEDASSHFGGALSKQA